MVGVTWKLGLETAKRKVVNHSKKTESEKARKCQVGKKGESYMRKKRIRYNKIGPPLHSQKTGGEGVALHTQTSPMSAIVQKEEVYHKAAIEKRTSTQSGREKKNTFGEGP